MMDPTELLDAAVFGLKRRWWASRLRDPAYRFLFAPPPADEYVSLDCETTGLDRARDEIVAIGAVRIAGNRIVTSERLEILVRPEQRTVSADSIRVHRIREADLEGAVPAADAIARLLHFIGSRPMVGYYLEFDVAMLNRLVKPLLGIPLPQPKIEVSALYCQHKYRQQPGAHIDLRFDQIMTELEMPKRDAHDAFNDAMMAAMAFIKLRQLRAGSFKQG